MNKDIYSRDILYLVIGTSILGQIATDIYLPSLPTLVEELNTETSWLKATVSIFFAGYAISQFLCGPLSDRYGRKRFMLLGVVLFAFGCYLAIISTNIYVLLLSRTIQGLGTGCFGVANRAILFDAFEGISYTKSIAIVSIVMAISPMLAPAFGGMLHDAFGWQSMFIFMLAYAMLLLCILFHYLPETLARQSQLNNTFFISDLLKNYKEILASQHFWIFGLINMFGFTAFIFYLGTASFIIQNQLGYTPSEYGKLISVIAIGYIAGGCFSNYLINTLSRIRIIIIGNFSQIFSVTLYLILYFTKIDLIYVVLCPMIFFVFGTGMINSNATSMLVTGFPKYAASSAAAMGCLMTFGTAVINTILFISYSSSILFIAGGLLCFSLFIKSLIMIQSYRYENASHIV